jgi:hypothetical protein
MLFWCSGVGGCARLHVRVWVCWLWFVSARTCERRLKVLQGLRARAKPTQAAGGEKDSEVPLPVRLIAVVVP